MIVDSHSHVRTEEALRGIPKRTIVEYERIFHQKWDPIPIEETIRDMDEAGVDKAVIVAVNAETAVGHKIANEHIAELVDRYPDRLIGYASVDPHKGALAVKEFGKAVGDLGLKGLKLLPHLLELNANDRLIYPLYEKAQEFGVPVLFHSGTQFDVGTKIKYCRPIDIDEVAVDFPDLKIVIAHFGWPWTEEAIAVVQRNRNVYFDIAGWAPKYLPQTLLKYMDGILSSKALFATDYPLLPRKRVVSEFDTLPLKVETKKKVLSENVKQLLKI